MSAGARGSNLKAKNSAMAARMKADGICRRTMRCPICHHLIGISGLFAHMGRAGCRSK